MNPLKGVTLPACPSCGGELSRDAVIDSKLVEERLASGIDTTGEFWHVRVRCPSCERVVRLEEWFERWSAHLERKR